MSKILGFIVFTLFVLGSLSAQSFLTKINPFPHTPDSQDTVKILAVMVDFQEDNDAATFGNGKFGTIYSKDYGTKILDPLPHNKEYFESHLLFVKNYFDKIVSNQDRFDDDIAALNPERTRKDQLDRMDYNKLKVSDVQKVLEKLQNERELIKEKVEHFSNQINQAKVELTNKDKQIDGIKSEIALVETFENSSQSEIENGKDVTEVLQKELKSLAPKNESEKIFGAINSLVVLLNSKNQTTLNELNAVKNEFKKMKQEYDKIMYNLEQKK